MPTSEKKGQGENRRTCGDCDGHVVPLFGQLMAGEASFSEPLLELPCPLSASRGQTFWVCIRDAVDRGLSFLRHREVDQRLGQRGGASFKRVYAKKLA